MRFQPTSLAGVTLIEFASHQDGRGSFQRLWCQREFEIGGLPRKIVQVSLSQTKQRGTLRGLHYQLPPSREDKLIQCVNGHIFDVALDLRPTSSTFLQHYSIELSASEPRALFIPAGCAHGFLTLAADCRIIYMMSDFYDAELSRGVRWNDPAFNIKWPEEPLAMIRRDSEYPDVDLGILDAFLDY